MRKSGHSLKQIFAAAVFLLGVLITRAGKCVRFGMVFGPWLGRLIVGFGVIRGASLFGGQPDVSTTHYVSRHFEVRDHDQPVKYVFDGNARVARITGSLSSRQRLQRMRLRAGWNSFSLAITATNLVGQLNQFSYGPSPLVASLYRWQPTTRDYAGVSAGQMIEAGAVLWLKARTNALVALAGSYLEPTAKNLPQGGGLISGAGLETWSPILPPGVTIWKYDSGSGGWRAGFTGDLAPISNVPSVLAPGDAVYVHTSEAIEMETPDPAQRVLYYHPDHLSSSTAVTDGSGNLTQETAFYPFGATRKEQRLRDIEAHYGFTEKERDEETGLHYFGHRFLHSALGRWISVDPLLEKGGGQNPYAYVNQSPLKHQDPDGAEITVVKGKEKGITTYDIRMQAVLIDVSSAKFTQQEIAAYASKLKAKIESSFKGKEGKSQWKATVNLRVIRSYAEVGDCDHVIRIMDKTRDDAAGATVSGTKVIDIAARTLRRLRPDQVDQSNPINKHYTWENYISPEGTGAHEFGHSAGLPHVHGKGNLMQPGSERKSDNDDITLEQIKIMHKASSMGQLNQRDKELNEITRRQ